MKSFKKMCITLNLLLFVACAQDPMRRRYVAETTVVTEEGKMVIGAKVSMSVLHTPMQEMLTGETHSSKTKEISDSTPLVIKMEGYSYGMWIEHPGYYPFSAEYRWSKQDIKDIDGEKMYLKKYNVLLQKKKQPRPLFSHIIPKQPLPDFGKKYGYDLEVADLVYPHGRGKVIDFYIQVDRTEGEGEGEGEVYQSIFTLTFPNASDGIIPVQKKDIGQSKLLLGHQAPNEGYQKKYVMRKEVYEKNGITYLREDPSENELNNLEGFWFRTRSIVDPETGEIRARYGKILEDIYFVTTKWGAGFSLTYYFAPDESPSLEFNGESLVTDANLQGLDRY